MSTDEGRRRQRQEAPDALALARLLREAGRSPQLAYRCRGGARGRSGCLLLAVYPSDGRGPLLYRPTRRLSTEHARVTAVDSHLPEWAALLDTLTMAAGGQDATLAGITECMHSSAKRDPLSVNAIRADLAGGESVVMLPREARPTRHAE